MTANLDYYTDADGNKQAAVMLGSNTPAWHNEGNVISGRATALEVLQASHTDWTVSKRPLWVKNPAYTVNGTAPKGFEIKEQCAIMRDDRLESSGILGIVGKDYQIIQNHEQLNILDGLVGRDECVYETAGSLCGGRIVWLLAKLPDQIIVKGKDVIDEYLLLATSHDGSMSQISKFVGNRICCQNTLNAGLGEKTAQYKIKHTSNALERMAEAAKILGLAKKQAEEVGKAYNYLATKQFDTTILNYFLVSVFPMTGEKRGKTEKIRQAVELLATKTGKGIDLAGSTLWGLYNAATEYASHVKKYQEKTEKMDALMFGSGEKLIKRSFDVALSIPEISDADMWAAIKEDSEKGKKEEALIA